MSSPTLLNVWAPLIKTDGTALDQATNVALIDCVVDLTINAPSMVTLRFDDYKLELVNSTKFKLGTVLEVSVPNASGVYIAIAKVEVTAVEPEFRADGRSSLLVRGLHKVHRLHYKRRTRTFQSVKDTDIIGTVLGEYGISVTKPTSTVQYPHVYQWNQTDMEFMLERARRVGLVYKCVGDAITFFELSSAEAGLALTFGTNTSRFSVRATTGSHVGDVTFAGWDPKQKAAITGAASAQGAVRSLGDDKLGASTKLSTVYAGASLYVDMSLPSQAAAEKVAGAYQNESAEGAVEVEAELTGDPAVLAGKKVTLANVGARFSGTYLVTTARHVINNGQYDTLISASGWGANTFANLVGAGPAKRKVDGVMVAVVTDNKETTDSGKFGSVKVKYPYYSNSDASWWARYTSPMAGNGRGMHIYPEVDDEVLVAFEDGDPNRPVVIGSLWNGMDATPQTAAAAVVNGKVEKRIFKTRVGHFIEFNDTADAEQITIQDKGGNKIILFAKSGSEKITIEAKKDMDIKVDNGLLKITAKNYDLSTTEKITVKSTQTSIYEATQDLTIKSAANIKGTATQNIEMAATSNFKASGTAGVTIESTANVKINATANVEIAATAQFKASGTAMAEISGGGMLKLGGALINIG